MSSAADRRLLRSAARAIWRSRRSRHANPGAAGRLREDRQSAEFAADARFPSDVLLHPRPRARTRAQLALANAHQAAAHASIVLASLIGGDETADLHVAPVTAFAAACRAPISSRVRFAGGAGRASAARPRWRSPRHATIAATRQIQKINPRPAGSQVKGIKPAENFPDIISAASYDTALSQCRLFRLAVSCDRISMRRWPRSTRRRRRQKQGQVGIDPRPGRRRRSLRQRAQSTRPAGAVANHRRRFVCTRLDAVSWWRQCDDSPAKYSQTHWQQARQARCASHASIRSSRRIRRRRRRRSCWGSHDDARARRHRDNSDDRALPGARWLPFPRNGGSRQRN